jgi:gliding motility-associated protein GldM
MAGGKETPRQRMIGMMYLVLTALLALQVSNQILQKFVLLNDGMERTSLNYAGKNQFLIEQMQLTVDSTGKKEEDVKLISAAKEVRKSTQELYSYIEDLKQELIIQSNAKDENGSFLTGALKNTEASGNIFQVNGKGEILKKKLNDFPLAIKKLLTDGGAEGEFKVDTIARDASQIKLFNNDMEARNKSFVTLNFVKSPVGAVLAILSQYQNTILNIESEALALIQANLGTVFTPIDQFNAKISATSNTVAAGTKFSGEMYLAASSSFSLPTMTVDGRAIPVDEKGIGKIEFVVPPATNYVNGQAKRVLTAKINNSSNGEDKSYDLTYEYTVAQPVIKISSEVVQQLYLGCANELSIEVPALGTTYAPDFSFTNADGIKGGKPGSVTVVPKSLSEVAIGVSSGGNKIGTETFKVKPVPDPTLVLQAANGKELDLSSVQNIMALSGAKIVAKSEATFARTMPKDANYAVSAGRIQLSRNGVARGAEARISGGGGFNSLLESAAPGDVFVVFIDEITRTNFRGEKITLPSFKSSFTVRVK